MVGIDHQYSDPVSSHRQTQTTPEWLLRIRKVRISRPMRDLKLRSFEWNCESTVNWYCELH